jgi:hypothetical protein
MVVDRIVSRSVIGLLAAVASLVTVASAAGTFLRGNLATQPFTTVRGDAVDILVGGAYRFNGKSIAAEGIGWDAVTLFLVVPAMLLSLPYLRRGSLRARLFTTGILAYFTYQYFEYSMALAYGPLFPVYVAIGALSVSGLAILLSDVDLADLRARIGPSFPRRPMIAFGIFMAVMLCGMWLPLIAQTYDAASVPQLNGATTLVVQAFDLGLLVPLGLFTAACVARGVTAGYILSAVVVVKGTAMGAGIAAMLIVEWSATGVSQLPPIIIFAAVSVVAALLAVRVYGSIQPGESAVVIPAPQLEVAAPV